jgi:tetratricopeptide (TPR) repeat protein
VTAVNARHILDGAEALIDARKYEQALALASEAVALQPGEPAAYAVAARALTGLDRIEDATTSAWQAVTRAPQVAYYHRLMAVTLIRQRPGLDRRASHVRLLNASAEAREAIRLAPYDASNYVVLAECYARIGDRKPADEAVRKALQLNPNSANNWATASFVATRARNWYAAEIAARKALAIDPQNYAATNNLGVALRSRGRWMQGAVAFAGAARIDPRSSTARENVEGIGFQYLNNVGILLLLPLVVVWPLFVAGGISLKRWLGKKPARLVPTARRLGMWIATSKRHQKRFNKEAVRAEKMAAAVPADGWSSLHLYRPDNSAFVGGAVLVALLAVVFAFAGANAANVPAAVACEVLAAAILGFGLWKLRIYLKRRRPVT